jgi:predicted metal-dependent phosphoesterase TrpH
MAQTLKIDLHTHPFHTLRGQNGVVGIRDLNKNALRPLVEAILKSGLNGIAITETDDFNWGWVAALQIKEHFPDQGLLILPGREQQFRGQHFLQIYVPEEARRRYPFFRDREWLNILAHPGYYQPLDLAALAEAQIDFVEEASLKGGFAAAQQIIQERGIPAVRASDARSLEEIGSLYMELEADLKPAGKHRQSLAQG